MRGYWTLKAFQHSFIQLWGKMLWGTQGILGRDRVKSKRHSFTLRPDSPTAFPRHLSEPVPSTAA